MKVQGKVIVVTGGANGIGKQLVLALLEKDAKVVAIDRDNDALEKLKTDVTPKSEVSLRTVPIDLTDQAAVEKLPEMVIHLFGQVDGIINNAGIIQPFVRVNELSMEQIDHVLKVNLYAQIYMIKAFLPLLLIRPEGHIVNVSSMGGFLPVPGQSIYGASKAAVKLLSEGLYAELLESPVRVSVVFPGATHTEITKNSGVDIPTSGTEESKIKMLEPDVAARKIIEGMERNKLRIFLGKDSKTMNLLYRIAPVFSIKMISKQMKELLN